MSVHLAPTSPLLFFGLIIIYVLGKGLFTLAQWGGCKARNIHFLLPWGLIHSSRDTSFALNTSCSSLRAMQVRPSLIRWISEIFSWMKCTNFLRRFFITQPAFSKILLLLSLRPRTCASSANVDCLFSRSQSLGDYVFFLGYPTWLTTRYLLPSLMQVPDWNPCWCIPCLKLTSLWFYRLTGSSWVCTSHILRNFRRKMQ